MFSRPRVQAIIRSTIILSYDSSILWVLYLYFIVSFNCIENYLGSINERCNHSSLKFFNIINEIELTIGHLNFENILSFVMNSKYFIIIIKNLLNFKISKIQNLIEKTIWLLSRKFISKSSDAFFAQTIKVFIGFIQGR